MKPTEKYIRLFSIILLLFLTILIPFLVLKIMVPNINEGSKENFCSLENRDTDLCIAVYEPVCGWYNPSKVQCIKYPCAKTFSNSCFACMDENVLYWTEGECPE